MDGAPPTEDRFLSAPAGAVAGVAPATVFFTPGGTRRQAVLAGIIPDSEEYPQFAARRMIECTAMFFRLGVRHLVQNVLIARNLAEAGRYRARRLTWVQRGLTEGAALAEWRRRSWRVRLVGVENLPELHATAAQLRDEATPERWKHTLWLYATGTPDAHWQEVLAAAQRTRAATQLELIRALYGEDVPLATMCVSTGKPILSPEVMPLVLAGDVQCYWVQRPGFALDEPTLRQIIYDHAYLRKTWIRDKTGRYGDVTARRDLWERQLVLGLGQRVGAFWYPATNEVSA